MLSQVDPSYLRLIQSYAKVVQHRNGVLTRLGGRTDPHLLDIWDQKLVTEGTQIILRRRQMMRRLSDLTADAYNSISKGAERLSVEYISTAGSWQHSTDAGAPTADQVAASFAARLQAESARGRDTRVTPVGPHRDDLGLEIDGAALLAFGSRGQQRTAALALRMAEARYIHEKTGRQPVLLLDEALGELDDERRDALITFASYYSQVILTGTSLAGYPDQFLRRSTIYEVHDGELRLADRHTN
jgi:DNA replication and repair protein RecF